MDSKTVLEVVKDLGVPLAMAFLMFKLFMECKTQTAEIQKENARQSQEREDRYVKMVENNTRAQEQLLISMQNVSSAIRSEAEERAKEVEARHDLLMKLAEIVMENRRQIQRQQGRGAGAD